MDSFEITISDLRFYSCIGVLDQERVVGNEFRVDICIHTDASRFVSENLDTTVSYADVYAIVCGEMSKEWLLLESAAKAIVELLLSRFLLVNDAEVKITKVAAPISGLLGDCAVKYAKSRTSS